jgi:DnaJ like chaperone protein
MRGWSKAVGAGLGYIIGGPIGSVLGYMAGHKLAPKTEATEGHLLIANLLGFAALCLKASATPSLEECKETVRFISRLFRFDRRDELMALELLDRLLAVDLDISAMAKSFRNHSNAYMRLRLLKILSTLCLLRHCPLEKPHLALLTEVAELLNLSQSQWQAVMSRYRAQSPMLDAACCYALLGIYPELPENEIRAAYRRLAKTYHPDLVAHLDQTAQKKHMERMTLINSAYETIRAQRGF